jgi:hypothetical protein
MTKIQICNVCGKQQQQQQQQHVQMNQLVLSQQISLVITVA